MLGPYFSHNGKLLPISEAKIDLENIYYQYGFGVYETLKVRKGIIYFTEKHVKRLLNSARIIGLKNRLQAVGIVHDVQNLVKANKISDANIKMLLIGGNSIIENKLYIICLNPLFVDQKFYQQGVKIITYTGERVFPQSKTLNMLVSFLAYREAKKNKAYDALLVNQKKLITEGTRTNLFYTDGSVIYTPPAKQVLEGVTRNTLIQVIRKLGVRFLERELEKDELEKYSGYFLTSTSSKVLPVSLIDRKKFVIPEIVKDLMKEYNNSLDQYVETRHASSLQKRKDINETDHYLY